MRESYKAKVREYAKDWGCKIEDSMAFYHHYNEYRSYQYISFGVIAFMVLVLIVSII